MHIIIVGCGRVGSELAKILAGAGHDVVVVDKNETSFKRLGDTFNGLTICGNGFNLGVLRSAGVEKAEVLCALTNGDNTNLMTAQVAKKMFNVPKVIARVYDPQRAETYRSLGLDIISGTTLIASMIRDKIIESRFSSYLIETGDLGVLRVEVKDDLLGKKVEEVNVPQEFSVVTVIKKGKPVLPQAGTLLEKNDTFLGLVKVSSLSKIKKKLKIE